MLKVKYLHIIVLSLISISCTNESITKNTNDGIALENKVIENILYTDTTKYALIFRIDAPILGYSTVKQSSLSNEEFYVIDDTQPFIGNDSTNMQKSKASSGISLVVNGMDLNEFQVTVPDGRQRSKAVSSVLYGSEVSFTLKRNTTTLQNGIQKIVSSDTTIMMYVPNIVEITSPKIETSEELFPYCYYKNFELKWNSDNKNENGLVVMVEWYGSSIKSKKEDKYIRNIDIIPNDNGSFTLNDKIFDNIPEFGIAYITLLRGNISILDNLKSDPYRIVAASHAILPLVLIRNI